MGETNRAEVTTDDENFDNDKQKVISRSKVTRKVTMVEDDQSVSSLEIENETRQKVTAEAVKKTNGNATSSSNESVTSETAALTKNSRKSKGGNLGSTPKGKSKYLKHHQPPGSKFPTQNPHLQNLSRQGSVNSSSEGSFRFLETEEIESPSAKKVHKINT